MNGIGVSALRGAGCQEKGAVSGERQGCEALAGGAVACSPSVRRQPPSSNVPAPLYGPLPANRAFTNIFPKPAFG